MEVVLHYRPSEVSPEDVQKIGLGSLEAFPCRPLPKFSPWFPHSVTSFILKPQRCAPILESASPKEDCGPFDPLNLESILYYDPTPSLLDFKPNVCTDNDARGMGSPKDGDGTTPAPPPKTNDVSKENAPNRTWSICTQKATSGESILPPSEELKSILDKCKLNLFHRGRWMISPSICGGFTLEEVWGKLNKLLKHKVLPGCNATLQKDIQQIWVFCDLRYCEHVAVLIKSEINLTGKLDLFVRKRGIIFSL